MALFSIAVETLAALVTALAAILLLLEVALEVEVAVDAEYVFLRSNFETIISVFISIAALPLSSFVLFLVILIGWIPSGADSDRTAFFT